MFVPRLGVNVDHVATLRQARGEFYPEVNRAAEVALQSGADQITIHLREDRRHIQDADLALVKNVTTKFNRPLNLEIGTDFEIAQIAANLRPEWICVVPEKREERTTEGGLNLLDKSFLDKTIKICDFIKETDSKIKISLFVESNKDILLAIKSMGKLVDAVEIHTGEYAKDFLEDRATVGYLDNFQQSKIMCEEMNIGFHAGHGLTDLSVGPLLEEKLFSEYNIGHWIISQSLFEGLGPVVKRLKNMFEEH